ncbi:hypothetical protein BDV28DRAFT_13573 [Aspergillus coremiiformis]|uniref:Uncharacterized protein n=1 Tax=Aspergillus coremiiformis TaxID=138285 RepID=A0A5N6Z2A1_9EURO|nr:hypothetical protein BDV28DRAFT_13573 [Aspergillus coremiiformis]
MGPIASLIPFSFPRVSTYFTPFSLSFSITFGSAGLSIDNQQQSVERQNSATYVPQTLVIGIFLALFVAQLAANGFQILRSRRQGTMEDRQNVQPEQETPRTLAGLQGEGEGEGRTLGPTRDAG